MTSHYPVVLEHEENGTVSAYVVGLPGVFAAADSERAAGIAIRSALRAHVEALQQLPASRRRARASLRIARIRYRRGSKPDVGFVGLSALLGRRRKAKNAPTSSGRKRSRRSVRP
jgi:predicted RNase H-like HicB family nuclease